METYTITFSFKDGRPETSYVGVGVPTTDGVYTIIETPSGETEKVLKSNVKQFHVVLNNNL